MRLVLIPILVALCTLALPSCGKKKAQASRDHISDFYGAFREYREANDDFWPETLEELKPYLDNWDELIVNPITGDNPGYAYTPPPTEGEVDDEFVILTQLRNGEPDTSLKKLRLGGYVD